MVNSILFISLLGITHPLGSDSVVHGVGWIGEVHILLRHCLFMLFGADGCDAGGRSAVGKDDVASVLSFDIEDICGKYSGPPLTRCFLF